MLTKFSGLNLKGTYLSLEKDKETFCVLFTYSVKRAREIRKAYAAVLQRWLKNVPKSVMHVQSCCFTKVNLFLFFFFAVLVAIAVVVTQAPFCCHPKILLPWSSDVRLLLSIK